MDDADRLGSIQAVADAILKAVGDLTPMLRHGALARAAELAGSSQAVSRLPPPLGNFVEKVARHAYKVTDSDLDALHEAGYSDDAIFEAVIATAVGAGLSRLRIGLRILRKGG